MARVKNGATTKARHKKVLKQAKGYFGSKHRLYKSAKEQLMHSGQYAFRDRKQKKREFRKLWITRINAACRENGISYSRFIEGLNKAGVEVNRKMLSEIAIHDEKAFQELVEIAKKGKEGKVTPSTALKGQEVIVESKAGKEEKESTTSKEETKTEEEKVDYSKMTVAELKEEAKKKNVSVTGMKKADIIAALEK
ncbi:MAG TPA: 50S ribosomal protein L20 [Candidatus Onthousia faecigallinarum]|nr:50S ribosomal protein L20 [Candidatus Onthousia faecigallinarum]